MGNCDGTTPMPHDGKPRKRSHSLTLALARLSRTRATTVKESLKLLQCLDAVPRLSFETTTGLWEMKLFQRRDVLLYKLKPSVCVSLALAFRTILFDAVSRS